MHGQSLDVLLLSPVLVGYLLRPHARPKLCPSKRKLPLEGTKFMRLSWLYWSQREISICSHWLNLSWILENLANPFVSWFMIIAQDRCRSVYLEHSSGKVWVTPGQVNLSRPKLSKSPWKWFKGRFAIEKTFYLMASGQVAETRG